MIFDPRYFEYYAKTLDPIQVFYFSRQLPCLGSTCWFWLLWWALAAIQFSCQCLCRAIQVHFVLCHCFFFCSLSAGVPAQSKLLSPAWGKTISWTTHVAELPSAAGDRQTSSTGLGLLFANREKAG